MKGFAPIGLSTYNRLCHLKKTIKSLQQNTLASQSDLYIFSDAPKNGDEDIVVMVREYIHTVDGFKEVHIIERETNDRVANNRGGMKQLLDAYGKMIWFEDDNIISEYFLEFANDILVKYKDDKSIFGISGFNVPMKIDPNYTNQYYLSYLFNGWGFATWGDRRLLVEIENNNAYRELDDVKLNNKIKQIHPTLHKRLKDIYEGKIDAGDYKIVFYLIKNNKYMIKPNKSFVMNIGHDNSGVHCGINTKFTSEFDLDKQKVNIQDDGALEYDASYDLQFYNYFHPKKSILSKSVNILKKLFP